MQEGACGKPGIIRAAFLSMSAVVALIPPISAQAFAGKGGGPRPAAPAPGQTQLPTTVDDFFEPGTQEGTLNEPIYPQYYCLSCHSFSDDGNPKEVVAPWDNWASSLMAQATRDPVWRAALNIANQDMASGGDTCIRCHSPGGWLAGHSVPTDGSALVNDDFDGINCNFCHRLVNPVAGPNNPAADIPILEALVSQGVLPNAPGNGRYVVDPEDARRGPLPFCDGDGTCGPNAVPSNYHGVPIYQSPFHLQGQLCGTCHDVSNAAFTRQANGTYTLNAWNSPHPTGNHSDMMPEQRTFSEWANSAYPNTGVYFADHRFGGNHPTHVMHTCQDCHMPLVSGGLCIFWDQDPFFPRPDIPQHGFAGANNWVIGAVYDEFGDGISHLNDERIALNQQRVVSMLQAASDMQLVQLGDQLKVRIVNYSGHKLPTGYPEGRRLWFNVKFYDANDALIAERGRYDFGSATLYPDDTKVYEMKLGMDKAVANQTNLPGGASFHLVLNNVVLKDNRIPPIGFNNAAFDAIRAKPVGATYADGQYWDDTQFAIPAGSAQAVVTLYYQTSSREYMEFLRDTNHTAGNTEGQNAYDRWVARGMSAPVDMDLQAIPLTAPRIGDATHDGIVNIDDLVQVITHWGPCPPPNLCAGDVNGNGVIDIDDLVLVVTHWG